MTPDPTDQLDLLTGSAGAPHGRSEDMRVRLAIALSHRQWLRFLSEEWLFPDTGGWLVLGLDSPINASADQGIMTIAAWFDPAKLPSVEVPVRQDGTWSTRSLAGIDGVDAIAWDGPLPLFAVERFTIGDKDARAHLMAMARNFADMELPIQPIAVEPVRSVCISAPPNIGSTHNSDSDWNRCRGAASMALWGVPAMGPWIDVLRDWLNDTNAFATATAVGAPWLSVPPWAADAGRGVETSKLWSAILGELSQAGPIKEFRPRDILEGIASRARDLGENPALVEKLVRTTSALLQDRGTISHFGLHDDTLALALQLVLLRPSPERFVTWRDDLPAVPPGSWWTGAILSGYLSGFRALPLLHRGTPSARKFLALRTWRLAKFPWGNAIQGPVEWHFEQDTIVVRSKHEILSELKAGVRGLWYAADLLEPTTRQAAEALIREFCPSCMSNTLVLNTGEFAYSGEGAIRVDLKKQSVHVDGRVEIALATAARIESRLDQIAFRTWLATAGIAQRMPKPPPASSKSAALTIEPAQPNGLRLVEDFISPEEEASLLATIDAGKWDTAMSRRVQHHGWRYDYKAKKVDPAGYIGPLPDWAAGLAHRLHDRGLIPELPDQVIVNEYVGQQGIAKHIDCPACFRGPIVTISLIETWEMVFTKKAKPAISKKFEILLSRRSAAILDGEARNVWQHEIPKKKGRPPRGRRVSITFRKVNN